MVHAALAALVPGGDVVWHTGARIGAGVDDVPATAVSHGLLCHRDTVASWNHSFGELHIFELLGANAGVSAAGRQTSKTIRSESLEKKRSWHRGRPRKQARRIGAPTHITGNARAQGISWACRSEARAGS